MDPIIPKEDALQAKAWAAPDFGRPSRTTDEVVAEDAPVSLPTASDIAAMFDQARAQGFEEGRRQGYDEGRAAGLAAGHAQAQIDAQALRGMLERLRAPVDRLEADVEEGLVALAVELARQVLLTELHTRPEQIHDVLQRALAAFPASVGVPWVRLHPDDVALLREVAPGLEDTGLALMPDESLQRGDLVLASGGDTQRAGPDRRWRGRSGHDVQSELDLRLEERWRQVMARLFEDGSF